MAIPVNQQSIIDASAKLLADIFSQFSGTPEDYTAAIVGSLGTAFAAQTTKATPLQIVNDSFGLATAVANEVGIPKVSALISDLQTTEQDAIAGKLLPAIADVIADYKAIKALA
jgi:hypothetical protein